MFLPQVFLILIQELAHNNFRNFNIKGWSQEWTKTTTSFVISGLLQFAIKVVRPFLRRLYALWAVRSQPDHLIRLSHPAQAHVLWWFIFVEQWNGISLLWDLGLQNQLSKFTQCVRPMGLCAYSQFNCAQLTSPLSIAVKELIPVVIAAATLGHNWGAQIVDFILDNEAVVPVLNATFSSVFHLMHLIRFLMFFAAKFNFWFVASHIQEIKNVVADALSRNYLSVFFTQVPQADYQAIQIPSPLVSFLLQDITWICKSWIRQFNATDLALSSHKKYEHWYLKFCSSFQGQF